LKFQGKVWRHIPAGSYPLNLRYLLLAGGRWNRAGVYGCLYSSLTRAGAQAEYHKYLQASGAGGQLLTRPRELVSLRVTVEPVMDLTDPGDSPVSPGSPFLTADDETSLDSCRELADALRAQGFAALIAPSAAKLGAKNLVLYFDGPAKNLDLDDGGDRIPIRLKL
jgi:RES domain-containing protein